MADQPKSEHEEPQRPTADEDRVRGIADQEDDFDDDDDLDEEDADEDESPAL